jgi:hypothetical protein
MMPRNGIKEVRLEELVYISFIGVCVDLEVINQKRELIQRRRELLSSHLAHLEKLQIERKQRQSQYLTMR